MRSSAGVLLFVAGALAGCGAVPDAKPLPAGPLKYPASASFVTVGDTQRTSPVEIWREQNDAERAAIVRAIAGACPAFVIITGDLVDMGGSPAHWSAFDDLMTPVRERKIPVFAVFGNHEYWGGHAVEPLFKARFPHQEGVHWFSLRVGPLRLLLLDSNRDDLDDREWKLQKAWYERSLRAADDDAGVGGVLVFFHHSPYSNSTVTGDDGVVQAELVPPFVASRKALLMETGHVHSYERFEDSNKVFLVSGGGGGPRHALLEGTPRHHDLVKGGTIRDFHFNVFKIAADELTVEVRGFGKGETVPRTIDTFGVRLR